MKIVNHIILWDVYVVLPDGLTAEEEQAQARAAVLSLVRDQEQPLRESESNTLEVRSEREVRGAWLEERPIVANSVSDEDFEQVKGKTCRETFALFHTKAGKEAAAVANGKKKAAAK